VLRAALLVPAGAALIGGVLAVCGSGTGPTKSSAPSLVRARPRLTHGVAAGDAWTDGALVWARSDVPATMIVEAAATEDFARPTVVRGPMLTLDSDGTGRVRLHGLEPGQHVFYRVTLEGEDGVRAEPVTGAFTTAPAAITDIKFIWSGDVAGQGWGINADTGGMTVWKVMADRNPDFFIHSGDAIYSDNPIEATQQQNDGRMYRNVTTPAKSQVAQTLDQFRGNYQYNLTDATICSSTPVSPTHPIG
jgi:alkaline phosphatase D